MMTTREAIKTILPLIHDEILVCTTGYISRDVNALHDRPQNFYMIGSMGLAPAIGLGIALSKPDKRIIVFDGDGSLLMGLGILPMAGTLKPKNFFHIVFDNECYESTGNQKTYSREVALEKMAESSGYEEFQRTDSIEQVKELIQPFLSKKGPAFLLIKCQTKTETPSPRVPYPPEEITTRLHRILTAEGHPCQSVSNPLNPC